jgi:hypothetical protein
MNQCASGVKVLMVAVLIVGLSLYINAQVAWAQDEGTAEGIQLRSAQLQDAIQVQRNHESRLFSLPGVLGVGIGLTEDGDEVAIHVYFNPDVPSASHSAIPRHLDNMPVRILETDDIVARDAGDPGHRQVFNRPVPMGVSTGNPNGIFAGTLGFRAVRAGNPNAVGYVTNNHVAAASGPSLCVAQLNPANLPAFGLDQCQPGLLDPASGGSCTPGGRPQIGDLVQVVPIIMGGVFENVVDAAFVSSTRNLVDKSIRDIGAPSPNIVIFPALNQTVQKSGRTTGFTQGTITTINGTFNVNYGAACGTAKFVGQMAITALGSFSAGGDSGSLIVTTLLDSAGRKRPVGLLFAGSTTSTIANPIVSVMGALGVLVDAQ